MLFSYTLLMPHISTLDWSTHAHIWLDIDETLASTVSWLIAYAQSRWQLLHIRSIEDIRKHDASWLGSDITPEEVSDLWEGYGRSTLSPRDVAPVEYAIEGVKELYESGKTLSIITARSSHEPWKVERTLRWVRWYFAYIEDADIHFVNHFTDEMKPKSEVCHEIWVSIMIDDSMENAHELCLSGIACILMEKPWNRDIIFDHPLLYRVHSWQEIIDSLHANT